MTKKEAETVALILSGIIQSGLTVLPEHLKILNKNNHFRECLEDFLASDVSQEDILGRYDALMVAKHGKHWALKKITIEERDRVWQQAASVSQDTAPE